MKRINLTILTIAVVALASCTKGNPDVVLKSISFKNYAAGDSITVSLGMPTQLTPVFTPKTFDNIPVEWSSSNNSVVTVAFGTVTATGPGKAWITIKDKNSATTGKIKFIVK